MPILKKSPKPERQLNIKITETAYARYSRVKDACHSRGWEFTLQPDIENWLNAELASAEKELAAAEKQQAKQASQSDVSA